MKHTQKVKLARKMMTQEERKLTNPDGSKKVRVSIFDSKAWNLRKEANLKKQKNQGKKKQAVS